MSSTTQHPLLVEIDGKTWFHERNNQWPGMSLTLEVKRVVYHSPSKFQDVLVFESTTRGMILVLDGAILASIVVSTRRAS